MLGQRFFAPARRATSVCRLWPAFASVRRSLATDGTSTGSRRRQPVKAVEFQLTPEQARDRLVAWNGSHALGASLSHRMNTTADATFLPFYLFDVTLMDVRLSGNTRVGRTLRTVTRGNQQSVNTIEWTAIRDLMPTTPQGVSIHDGRGPVGYSYRTHPGFAVYASHTYPLHHVEVSSSLFFSLALPRLSVLPTDVSSHDRVFSFHAGSNSRMHHLSELATVSRRNVERCRARRRSVPFPRLHALLCDLMH
jgi:hypothetical protein